MSLLLALLRTIFTPSGSVKCLKEVFEHISGYDRRQGMDESLPLVIMAVVRAKWVPAEL